MPTETELIDQLKSYGAWLEAQTGAELGHTQRPGPSDHEIVVYETAAGPDLLGGDPEGIDAPRPMPRLVLVAAVIAAVVGLGALAQLLAASNPTEEPAVDQPVSSSTTAAQPPTDGEPLYVLPADLDEYQIRAFETASLPWAEEPTVVIGVPDDFGNVNNLSSITLAHSRPFGDYSEAVVADQTVLVANELAPLSLDVFAVPVDDRWLVFQTPQIGLRELLVEATGVVGDQIVFTPVDGFEQIADLEPTDAGRSRFLLLAHPGLEDVQVTSATVTSPFDSALVPGDYRAITVRGRDGYVGQFDATEEAAGTHVVWLEEPGQVVAVFAMGTDPSVVETMALAIAESLEVVDEVTWRNAITDLSPSERVELGPIPVVTPGGSGVNLVGDGVPTVLIAGDSECQECVSNLAAIRTAVEAGELPHAAYVAIRNEPTDTEWATREQWPWQVYSLADDPAVDPLRLRLGESNIVILDGSNRIVSAEFDLRDDDVVEQLSVIRYLELGTGSPDG